jgi:hypothetical protein
VYAHRLAFALGHGRWADEVDHVDGNRANNALSNLRECTRQQNQWNARKRGAAPSSRFKGVHWCKSREVWHARITVGYRGIFLGSFADEAEAGAAYLAAAQKYAGEFARAN